MQHSSSIQPAPTPVYSNSLNQPDFVACVATIALLVLPLLGTVTYRKYRKAVLRQQIELLERSWQLQTRKESL